MAALGRPERRPRRPPHAQQHTSTEGKRAAHTGPRWRSTGTALAKVDLELGPRKKDSKPKTEPQLAIPAESTRESAQNVRGGEERASER